MENTVEKNETPLIEDDDVEMGNDPEEPEIVINDENDEPDDDDYETDSYEEFDDDDESDDSDNVENDDEDSQTEESQQPKTDNGKQVDSQPPQKEESEQPKPAADGEKLPTGRQRLIQELATQLEVEDIPNTKEYRQSAIVQAKAAVCKELNIEEDDFNTFDEEHQFLFSEKLEEIRAQKKKKFDDAVERIEKRHAAEDNNAKIANLINSQCNTPEKKKKLYDIIRGASTGYTEDMKAELAQGKTDKLQKLINVATGKKALVSPNKKSKNTKTRRDRGYASDLVFGF